MGDGDGAGTRGIMKNKQNELKSISIPNFVGLKVSIHGRRLIIWPHRVELKSDDGAVLRNSLIPISS